MPADEVLTVMRFEASMGENYGEFRWVCLRSP